jgi:hypothetical protein
MVGSVHTHEIEYTEGSHALENAQRVQLSASKGAAAALMHGRRLAGVEPGLRSCRQRGEDGEPPVYLDWLNKFQTQALEAVQPLLSQLPFIELRIDDSELSPLPAIEEALGATTTRLRLKFHVYDHPHTPGNLSTVAAWLQLLDALPRVRTVQITFWHVQFVHSLFPVCQREWMRSWFIPAVEGVLSSAISACEQKYRYEHITLVAHIREFGLIRAVHVHAGHTSSLKVVL